MASASGWMVADSFPQYSNDKVTVWLQDLSASGKILIHGHGGHLSITALGLDAPAVIGEGAEAGNLSIYRLRNDQLFINTPAGEEANILSDLARANAGSERVTITDITHGRAQFQLFGPASAELLSRICALDFHPLRFVNRFSQQTSVAKTTQLVIRQDINEGKGLAYSLIGARSLGTYLWQSILESGQDLGIRPVGRAESTTSQNS